MSELIVNRHGCFYSGDYLVLPDGQVFVNPPKFCPRATASQCCNVRLREKVERKCGPGHKLCIYICRTHEKILRIYPLGWTPYSREPIVGSGSVFALLKAFSESSHSPMRGVEGRSLKTLYRKMHLALLLLGCLEEGTESCRCESGQLLGYPSIELNNLFEEIRAGPCLRSRAEALISVINPSVNATKRWIHCGTTKKCWGENISD